MSHNLAFAKRIIERSITVGWQKVRYEEIILVPYPEIGVSLADALGLSIPVARRDEAAFYAARALRREFTESNAAWVCRLSQDDEMERLIEIVRLEVTHTIEKRRPPRSMAAPPVAQRTPGPNGFVPWTPFRNRNPVPACSGVYMFARFDGQQPVLVDHVNENVIDIGMADKQTIKQRLQGFEQVALTGRGGKSSGWPYRNDFVRDYEELMNFSGLYVAWRTFPWSLDESVRDYEDRLLREYFAKLRRRPAINKQAFKRS